jgi:hypothetical protein
MLRALSGILVLAACMQVVPFAASGAGTNDQPPSPPQAAGNQSARFDPLFTASIPELKGIMEKTVGEALAMPSPEDARKHRVSPTLVVREREETIAWTRRILKPEWIDGKAMDDWLAIRGGVQGRDGLFGAWKTSHGPLQIVATKRRIHVRMVLPKDARSAPGPARIKEAGELARQMFQTDLDWSNVDWQVRDLGGFTFGYRELPFIANWWDSCLVVSDGAAVKFSFLKITHRDSPPGRKSGSAEDTPWFQATRRSKR